MRNFNLLFLLLPALCWATSYTVNQSGNWHTSTVFTPNGTPGLGDTIANSQYVLTCETGQTCNIGTVGTTSMTIGDGTHAATLLNNGTLVLRGQAILNGPLYDCAHAPGVTLATGSTLNLDENNSAYSSGFVIQSGTAPCIYFTIGASGDQCAWGTSNPTCPTNVASINNGTVNGILLLDSGTDFGDSITNWNGVAITNCGVTSTTVAGCYQEEMYQAESSWAWNQVYLKGDAAFGTNVNTGVSSNSSPVTINGAISAGRIQGTDIYFGSLCSAGAYTPSYVPACTGARSVANSLLRSLNYSGVYGDLFTAGATITSTYWDGQGASAASLTAANIAGGSWSYVVAAADAATCSESDGAYTEILAPRADHVYAICTDAVGVPLMLTQPSNRTWGVNVTLSNAIFDLESSAGGASGHCYLYGNDGGSDSGYSVTMSYLTVLKTPGLGYGCGFTQWSSVCPAAPTASITHLLSPGGTSIGPWYGCEGNTSVATAPALSAYKANIFYDSSMRVNPLMFGNSNAANQPANVVPPTGIDYNLNYNFVPFVTTPYTTACASGCTNSGSAYAIPMTGSAPGPHDLPPASPELLDNTRTAYTWANIVHGQAATAAGFRQVFVNGGPSAIGANVAALFYYINQGNIPARSLWNAMPDGTTIGPSQPVMFPGDMRTVTQ